MSMFDRTSAIIRREYFEYVHTKAFWISTLLVPFLLLAMMIIPSVLMARSGGDYKVAVLDQSGDLTAAVRERIAERLENNPLGNITLELEDVAIEGDLGAARSRLKEAVGAGDYTGVLVLPTGLGESDDEPEYLSTNVTAFTMLSILERSVSDEIVARRLAAEGLDVDRVEELTKRVDLDTLKLGQDGEESSDNGQAFLMSYMMVMILIMSMLIYGVYVMRGVLEEKSTKIVEILVSAVRPQELMLGKILGIGAVGLTQYVIWAVSSFVVTMPSVISMIGIDGIDIPELAFSQMIFFVIYFALGFLLFSTLFASVGAAFDNERDAQQFMAPINVLIWIPLILMFLVFNQPDSNLSIGLSLFPFFTPILMFLRIMLTSVPAWQILASIVLMVLSIGGMSWVAGKIYKIGILTSGSKPKIRDLWRWIRTA